MRTPWPAAILLVAASGCAVMTSSSTREVALDAQFSAPVGSSFRLEGTQAVVGVVSIGDSRCPTDVRCVTAGDAVIVVELFDGTAQRTDTLRLRGTPRSVAFATHRLQAVDVTPYPISTQRDRPSAAVLRVVE